MYSHQRFNKSLIGFISVVVLCGTTLPAADLAPRDAMEVLRADLKADRKATIAEGMQLTEKESEAFWPIYRNYREEMDKVTDHLVELILEYADLYPNVPEDKANEMLRQYLKMEATLLEVKEKYLKKLEKILPSSKVFRFAQLDNRFDLGTRAAMAASIPLMPMPKPQAGSN